MEDPPEIVKLLKYILFSVFVSHVLLSDLSHALVTEAPPVLPVPFYHSEEVRSDLISSFNGNREGFRNKPHSHSQKRQNDLDPDAIPRERNSGGHKETRQAPSGPSDLSRSHHQPERMMLPPRPHRRLIEPQDSLGSLCSIFRTFLEPRQFHRCHVSNGEPSGINYFDRNGPSGSSHRPLHSNDLNHDPHQGVQRLHQHHGRNIENRENHERLKNNGGLSPHDLRGPLPSMPSQSIAEKRYDHIDDIQINHSGEEDEDDHLIHSGLSLQQHEHDPTKISQDRTMIVVPERSCPPGQRRDPRGYCRRLVKIRTNYQYGPPPGVVRPIPIRYYYSRIVAIPTLHFFFQNV